MNGILYIDGEHKENIDAMVKQYIAERVITKNVLITNLVKDKVRKYSPGKGEHYEECYRVDFREVLDEIAGDK